MFEGDRHIILHSLLGCQGGAARISHLLCGEFFHLGIPARMTCEIRDRRDPPTPVIPPQRVGQRVGPSGLLHVHATDSWTQLLEGLQRHGVRPVITLHDAKLLTGGCASAMGCPGWRQGCRIACPQGIDGAGDRAQRIRALVRAVDPVLTAPSRWMARMARDVYPAQKIHVVPNGVPWGPSSLGAHSARGPMSGPTLLFVAHGGEHALLKGGDEWRFIWKRVKAAVPECKAIFVGGDVSRIAHDLTILPYAPHELLCSIMARSTLLVYPTRADNHPLIILEAMAQGLACVSYNEGGIDEQIRDGETGILVERGNNDGFVESIVGLLRRPMGCKRMGEQARRVGAKKFCVETMARGFLRVYERMG